MIVTSKRKLLYSVALVAISLAIWWVFPRSSSPKPTTTKQASNFNTISDSSTGLSFNMSKNFQPIPKDELAAMNPGFGYGFKPAGDPNALCIVSQPKLSGPGTITPDQLRDGALQVVKAVHPDAQLDNPVTASNPAKFGSAQGVLLQISYTYGATKIKRVEALALGKSSEVIGYCQSASTDSVRYYNDFTIFFSSLKLTQ